MVADYENFGGVASASINLVKCLSASGLSVTRYAVHPDPPRKGSRLRNYCRMILRLLNGRRGCQIYMHFEAILIGLAVGAITFSSKSQVFVIHTDLYGYYKGLSPVKRTLITVLMKWLRKKTVVFVSREAEVRAKLLFDLRNTSSIYNVLNEPDPELPLRDRSQKGSMVLGSIARLHQSKNIDLLIRAFDALVVSVPDCSLRIYGDGPERAKLENYASRFACSSRIRFMGEESDPEKMFGSIDALVGFSSIEGFSLVILEALARGVPVLHADCSCGPREIMAPETDPAVKTASCFMMSSGILVRPPEANAGYYTELSPEEGVYLHALTSLCLEWDFFSNASLPEAERFSCSIIASQWRTLLANR